MPEEPNQNHVEINNYHLYQMRNLHPLLELCTPLRNLRNNIFQKLCLCAVAGQRRHQLQQPSQLHRQCGVRLVIHLLHWMPNHHQLLQRTIYHLASLAWINFRCYMKKEANLNSIHLHQPRPRPRQHSQNQLARE